jgi:hypothetical protein
MFGVICSAPLLVVAKAKIPVVLESVEASLVNKKVKGKTKSERKEKIG